MGDLSTHFSEWEFACKGHNCCGGSAPVDGRLVEALEKFREKVGGSVCISSSFRCLTHNRSIGSSDSSQHPKGYAADILPIPGISIETMAELAEEVESFKQGGIGKYPNFLHLDVRQTGKARWDKRT